MNSGEMQLTLTGVSSAAIAAYKFAKLSTPETDLTQKTIAAAVDDAARILGITQTDANDSGQAVRVAIAGVSKLVVDGSGTAIAVGDDLTATAAGVGVKLGAVNATAKFVGAVALEASSAANDVILVKIVDNARVKGTA